MWTISRLAVNLLKITFFKISDSKLPNISNNIISSPGKVVENYSKIEKIEIEKLLELDEALKNQLNLYELKLDQAIEG